jgi:phage-related protein
MALNPFGLIAVGIGLLVTGIGIAYTQFEGFRNLVRNVVNGLSDYFEFMANSWIKATNVLITAMNLISPFKDIPKIGSVSFGKIGAEPTSGGFTSTAQAEAAMFSTGGGASGSGGGTSPTIIPSALIPAALGGSAKTVNASTPEPVFTEMGHALASDFSQQGIGGLQGFGDIIFNVNGGDPNAVVDALRDFMRNNGSVPITTANIY